MPRTVKNIRKDIKNKPRKLLQFVGLLLVCAAVYLVVSLLSYSSGDPSLNRAVEGEVSNIGGLAGAIVADMSLQIVGASIAIVVAAFAAWGWRLVSEGKTIGHVALRICSLLVSVTFLTLLLSFVPNPDFWPLSSGLGGSMGQIIQDNILAVLPEYIPGFVVAIIAAVLCFITVPLAMGLRSNEWGYLYGLIKRSTRGIAAMFSSAGRSIKMAKDDIFAKSDTDYDVKDDIVDDSEEVDDIAAGSSGKTSLWQRVFGKKSDRDYADDRQFAITDKDGYVKDQIRHNVPEQSVSLKAKSKAEKKVSRGEEKKKKKQASLDLRAKIGNYEMPSLDFLKKTPSSQKKRQASDSSLKQNAKLLESVLNDFGVKGEIVNIHPGPVVTLYELEPAAGTKSSRVIGLADDIARSMSAISARISVIPGRNAMGIELPNNNRETVYLREILEHDEFANTKSGLPIALGKNISGESVVVDLAKMPHLLVAGTTGSGKSVAVNTMITSLLYHYSPEQCKFIMIDPKMLELSVYDGIPHLLSPVVTEPGKAVVALKWAVKEMENRYRLMANLGVRNISNYNKRLKEARRVDEKIIRKVQTGFDPETGKPIFENQEMDTNPLPYIVVIVDEMADLMLVAGKEIEASIQRLAQMARAAGIHLIMATQRPSVDVITGVIKANFPTRISFQVTSKIDSRTILGEMGAEQLLGMGDMLYMAGGGRVTRVHGPFVSDGEVEDLVTYLKSQGEPTYIEAVTVDEDAGNSEFDDEEESDADRELYDRAVAIVARDQKASTSYIQRCLKIGYNRAARLIEKMEREGVVGAANHVGKREILVREPEDA